jgi:sugar phosphate isomerase/epimerase
MRNRHGTRYHPSGCRDGRRYEVPAATRSVISRSIAIEPLNRKETNVVNGVAEGIAVAERVALPSVRVLSDLYHVAEEDEPLADTAAAGAMLAHTHIAEPGSRHVPRPGAHEETYAAFLGALRQAGYDGRLSLECREMTPETAAAAIAMLREIADRVAAGTL